MRARAQREHVRSHDGLRGCNLDSVKERPLPPGVYDQLVDAELERQLTALPSNLRSFVEPIGNDSELAAVALARVLHGRLLRALRAVPNTDDVPKVDRQIALANSILELLAADPSGAITPDDSVARPGQRLIAVVDQPSSGLIEARPPLRPEIPLSMSDLLVNGHKEVRIGTEIQRELASADSIDLLCSFLKYSGFRTIEEPLREFLQRRPGGLRILTTAYMGATERRALDAFAALGAQIRVSYETDQTRLHAKAWLFHRASGFSTAFIGSSNLSHAAMLEGVEWNVRVSSVDNPPILERFATVFRQYWEGRMFEKYLPARDAERWDKTVNRQLDDRARLILAIHVDPKPHQQEVLDRLAAERERGHTKNLVVAATGTGKTFIAAFDYRELRRRLDGRASLLFVAHRHEILEQSRVVFRVVLGEASFGERLGNGEVPRRDEHVFANIQSLHEDALARLAPDAFDVVIIDEFHHAASDTYDALLRRLRPKFLLGLTATPERNDGKSILHWFDDRIASELRLWKALDDGLLSPFQYFGISDGTQLGGIRWTPTGYATSELRNVYTANDVWIKRVLQEVNRKISDPTRMRALGFCVDIAHAEFCAMRFEEAGLASKVLSRHSTTAERATALAQLQSGELRAIFSVDLLNEGIDVPDVDTVLFLRPTESATVFLQQLGRGLRRRPDKACLTVLDFIGSAHRRFRFDARFRAFVGGTRQQVLREIERGFPSLPSGCSIQLDRVATDIVLENIRESLGRGDDGLVEDLRAIGRDPPLADFLRETGLELEDVYARAGRSFTRLRRRAGLEAAEEDERSERFERMLARLLHVDDPLRLAGYRAIVETRSGDEASAVARMFFAALGWTQSPLTEMPRAWRELAELPAVRRELLELFDVLEDRRGLTFPLDGRLASLPLRVHATYGLDEIMAAIDERTKTGAIRRLREGVFHSRAHRADLLFVTLDKSEADYSPTTMYRDYAVSPRQFHWESQSGIHAETATGQRYVEHEKNGHAILLFVRQRRETRPGVTGPYTFLGSCRHVSHHGARPMGIEWALDRDMPAWLFQEGKVAGG